MSGVSLEGKVASPTFDENNRVRERHEIRPAEEGQTPVRQKAFSIAGRSFGIMPHVYLIASIIHAVPPSYGYVSVATDFVCAQRKLDIAAKAQKCYEASMTSWQTKPISTTPYITLQQRDAIATWVSVLVE